MSSTGTTTTTISIATPYWEISANLILPPDFDESATYPAVVSAHPIGSCKEQTSGTVYGAALAEQGFVVCAFDASTQGASGGEPSHLEVPPLRVMDFSFVVDHLVTLDYVDADRIGVLGICGGGGYAINATMLDRRFTAVGTVTGVNYGRLMMEGFSQYDPVGQLEKVAAQRTAEARGATQEVDDLLPSSVEEGKKQGVRDRDLLEATDYYRTPRGQTANGTNLSRFAYMTPAFAWDAFLHAEKLLTAPMCIVVGDQVGSFGAYRDGNEIYARAASTDKQLVVAEGWSHYDLYDQPGAVKIALDALVPFFQKQLGGR